MRDLSRVSDASRKQSLVPEASAKGCPLADPSHPHWVRHKTRGHQPQAIPRTRSVSEGIAARRSVTPSLGAAQNTWPLTASRKQSLVPEASAKGRPLADPTCSVRAWRRSQLWHRDLELSIPSLAYCPRNSWTDRNRSIRKIGVYRRSSAALQFLAIGADHFVGRR
jgi:hypothetical protein